MSDTKKRGRKPLFDAREVEEIQQSDKSLAYLANHHGVSRATIARIRSYGYEYAPLGSTEKARTHPTTRQKRTRSERLDEDTLRLIALDNRPQSVVARDWGVSIPYVAKLRAKHGTTNRPGTLLPPDVEDIIRRSDKTIEQLAAQFGVPELIIRRVRDGGEANTT